MMGETVGAIEVSASPGWLEARVPMARASMTFFIVVGFEAKFEMI